MSSANHQGDDAKTHAGADSLDVAMEAAKLFFDHPLSDLGHLLGVSRSTIKRIRKRLAALRGGPRTRFMNPGKQGSKNPSSGVEAENPDFPPSYSYFPPPPKGGVPPRGNQNSGPEQASKKTKTPARTSCPPDWQPRPEDRAYATQLGLDPERLRATMVDWSAEDPMRNRKTSWDATFRNWARREGQRIAAERARLEAQRKNYTQARLDATQSPLERDADRRAAEEAERRRTVQAIVRKYHPEMDHHYEP